MKTKTINNFPTHVRKLSKLTRKFLQSVPHLEALHTWKKIKSRIEHNATQPLILYSSSA